MTRNNYITALILSTLCINQCMAQAQSETPRLIVAITVDQLRSENIHAYSKLFVPSGFNKLFSTWEFFGITVSVQTIRSLISESLAANFGLSMMA